MLCQLTAIVVQTVRAAVRSRLLLSLLALLLFACITLPLSVQGDGTALSEMRIALSYTMAVAFLLLGVVTLWASAGAVSQEVEERQIRLLAVKPVSRYVLWLGKWLGVVTLNAAFLGVVALVLLGHVQHLLHRDTLSGADAAAIRAEVLVARARLEPVHANVDSDTVARRIEALRGGGRIPSDADEHELVRMVTRQMRAEQVTVQPGKTRSWTFDLPPLSSRARQAVLQYRMAPTAANPAQLPGTWAVISDANPVVLDRAGESARQGYGLLVIPTEHLGDARTLTVTYKNESHPASRTIVLHQREPVVVLIGNGSFTLNLLRSLVVLLCTLAALAALGVTMGTLFSFPVATFTSFAVLIVIVASHFFAFSGDIATGQRHAHHNDECEAWHGIFLAGEQVLRVVSLVATPVRDIHPVGKFSQGIRVHWSETGRAFLLLGILCPALLGLAGGWCLSRRELAAS